MRGCKRHPGGGSQPSGSSNINSNSSGVCSTCLEERLTWLWRGVNFQPGSAEEIPVTSSAPDELSGASATHEPLDIAMNSNSISAAAPLSSSTKADAAIAVVASIASIRKQLQVNGAASSSSSSSSNDAAAAPPNDESERHNNNNGGLTPDDCETTSSDTFFDGGNRRLFSAKSSPLPFSHDIKDVMKEWADLHSKRRAAMADTEDSQTKSRSRNLNPNHPGLDIVPVPARALSIGSRSLPLLNSTAEETALRVISEQATEDQFFEELELHQVFDATATREASNLGGRSHAHALLHEDLKEQACFSPSWQGKLSSKWVKVLVNPMISRNKVFPSRSKEDVRKTQARSSSSSSHSHHNRRSSGNGNRRTPIGAAGPWDLHEAGDRVHIPRIRSSSPFDIEDPELSMEGMSSDRILRQEYMDNPLSSSQDSVLSWLQDVPTPQTPVFQKYGRLEMSTSLSSRISKSEHGDPHINDLTTVGHLHEIAEEIEIFEESSVEDEGPVNISSEISSFGKFLIIAAQRQPKSSGLTRVLSAAATSG